AYFSVSTAVRIFAASVSHEAFSTVRSARIATQSYEENKWQAKKLRKLLEAQGA
ncbi:unnamed protein product, partial [marine sediment metagenome]